MKNIILILALVVAAGCMSEQQANQQTERNFSNPELVSENTPKGRLWRAVVCNPREANHYVYWFDNSTNSVTVNYVERHGKSSLNRVIVIDGVPYVPKL